MPKVDKKILMIIAGALWTFVGIMLMSIASGWLYVLSGVRILEISIAGIIAGIIISKFGFKSIAEKNITRIKQYEKKVCLFAFQRWQSYILILIMIAMGIFMKSRSFIPKSYLAVMYIGIGSALFLASFRYYIKLYKCLKLKS